MLTVFFYLFPMTFYDKRWILNNQTLWTYGTFIYTKFNQLLLKMICNAIKTDSLINYILNCYSICILLQQTQKCVPYRFWFHNSRDFHLCKLESMYHNANSWHLKIRFHYCLRKSFFFYFISVKLWATRAHPIDP